ncbi:hypothetical protein FRB94_007360 [Tulasnella sp. JGI-2019a]|nr:hypothetical protein FRB94_007360 [Tulasnella sp. JGI-2019a]KAG9014482.1 hypothetical protein FRB93_013607 [Tulasnella sp. JGI-2019a]KAG9039737.1 hypothetical protein FRB95_007164 [Tulasnella sp. JGI-2019a]
MSYNNPLRELGNTGVKIPAVGYGALSLSHVYGPANDDESRALLKEAVTLGCTFWDTANIYGLGHNEECISPVLKENRDKVFICTKFGIHSTPEMAFGPPRGDREYVFEMCDASLKRLGIEQIDLYYQHRVDPKVPIEETVKAMKELQDAKKVKYLGLSECSAETLERALKIARIEAVQIEYSPWETGPETSGLLEVMRKNKISLVAYSPLGRGMLTGKYKSPSDFHETDYRRLDPRYQGEAFDLNMRLVNEFAKLAEKKSKAIGEHITPAAFCLAWILYQGEDMIVIPGTKVPERLKENLMAGKVLQNFTTEDDIAVRKLVDEIKVVGERYDPQGLEQVNK